MYPRRYSTGVTITNPLVLYRALLATKRISPDPSQHRLAIHLQKLYDRLRDYEPATEYSDRLRQISRAVGSVQEESRALGSRSIWTSLLSQREKRDSLALTRVFTSHEAAMHLDSPKGLMLHGEVGTGKSMLIDLFADCLPNRKKRRWHFNTFMLEIFSKLEQLRRTRSVAAARDDDHSLLWLARDMIRSSPILFLDEFQLPDRAASKIMSNLLTSFFHLGGVLIATSNRMPEELAKAAGMEFTLPPTRMDSLRWKFGVLKARCEVWEMEGGKDYRRSESQAALKDALAEEDTKGALQPTAGLCGTQPASRSSDSTVADSVPAMAALPKHYFVKPSADEPASAHQVWLSSFSEAALRSTAQKSAIPWSPDTMRVYGRHLRVPRQLNGVTSWTFSELCVSQLGPADYITLASTFHTLILTDVPVLTLLQKNEARRFITLLDALYEARCKLLITAAAGPDDILFPESQHPVVAAASSGEATIGDDVDRDAVYSETFSDIYQDATVPFRPNVSNYDPSAPDIAEPDYTHARLQGTLAADALEDDPPNRIRRSIASGSFSDERDIGAPRRVDAAPDFGQTGTFTGEDERFAYKRARSRLWEMCGAKWWARSEEGWWRPVAKEVRRWEVPAAERRAQEVLAAKGAESDVAMGAASEIDEKSDEVLFRHGASPFRTHVEPPPKIGWTHVWGTMKWGKRAGAWGQGVEGLAERKRERGGQGRGEK